MTAISDDEIHQIVEKVLLQVIGSAPTVTAGSSNSSTKESPLLPNLKRSGSLPWELTTADLT